MLASNGVGTMASSFLGGIARAKPEENRTALFQWLGIDARPRKSPAGNARACTLSPSLDPAVPLHSATPSALRGTRLSLSIFSIHAFRNFHLRPFVDTRTCHLSRHTDIHGTTGYRTLEVLGKTGYATLRRRPSEDKGIENRRVIGKTGLSRKRKEVGTETSTDERTTANQPPFKFDRDWTLPRQTIGYRRAIVRFFSKEKVKKRA